MGKSPQSARGVVVVMVFILEMTSPLGLTYSSTVSRGRAVTSSPESVDGSGNVALNPPKLASSKRLSIGARLKNALKTRFFGADVADEVWLYPTYASRDPADPSRWCIRTHGWIYRPRVKERRPRVVSGLMRYFKVEEATAEQHVFERRLDVFVARNKKGGVVLACCGADGCGVATLPVVSSDRTGHFQVPPTMNPHD